MSAKDTRELVGLPPYKQRPIKFRAWSPYWKPAFLDGKPEALMEYFGLSELHGGYTEDGNIGIDEIDVIVMQYTGLKDKNGVECYWDDWVSDGINPKFLVTPDYHLLARLSEIEFEVIGNIWENPEKGVKDARTQV